MAVVSNVEDGPIAVVFNVEDGPMAVVSNVEDARSSTTKMRKKNLPPLYSSMKANSHTTGDLSANQWE